MYWFNQVSFEDPSLFGILGTVVALAIYNSIHLPIRFPLLMWKKLKEIPLSLLDLKEIDPISFSSLSSLIQTRNKGEDVSNLFLTFSYVLDNFGTILEVDLIPNGKNIFVTNDNLDEYIDKFVQYVLVDSIEKPFSAFMKGFQKLLKSTYFSILTPIEMDIFTSGEEVYDWIALKSSTSYTDGYTEDSQTVVAFWNVFFEMTNEQKKDFLMFCTGSPRAPVGGLANIQLIIQRTNDVEKLPVAHTCFNMFSLPDYQDQEKLRKLLLKALEYSEGFGII
jgi:hypothetical protein